MLLSNPTTRLSFLGVILSIGLAGCGTRTSFEDYELPDASSGADSSIDAPADVKYDVVNDVKGCNPSTCAGCCSPEGACLAGVAANACGAGGYACVNCSSVGAGCGAQTHQCDAPPPCSPSNCAGCCNGNSCETGGNATACGAKGAACSNCAAQGLSCDANTKSCAQAACNSSNCKGCCDVGGQCNWGGDSWACGMYGSQCQNCPQMGLVCDSMQGTCVGTMSCGPWNCNGCCDPMSGQCFWGGDLGACGNNGNTCSVCTGSASCQPTPSGAGVCTGSTSCGSDNCAGCCLPSGACFSGWDPDACGSKGMACQACNAPGAFCEANSTGGGTCNYNPTSCGPWNCEGCCDSGKCLPGSESKYCGTKGNLCSACKTGETCEPLSSSLGGKCTSVMPPSCSPMNCQGCCQNNVCITNLTNKQCGFSGNVCQDCTASKTSCLAEKGACIAVPNCGPTNCSGCCSLDGQCRPGSGDLNCGFGGMVCENCTQSAESCSNSVCQPNTTSCVPTPYGGCAASVTTPNPVTILNGCTQSDLQFISQGCANSTDQMCKDTFQKLTASNPTCAKCVSQFNQPAGSIVCAAPYMDKACNHSTSCAVECIISACQNCTSSQQTQCYQDVQMPNGTCSSYLNNLDCYFEVMQGTASFCNDQGSYGSWLSAVGNHYCGNGKP